jgi:ketosteroid isomerase-like protein
MLQRLEHEAACARLCVDFANYLDARRYQPVLELFTEDAILDRMGVVLKGRAEIKRFLDNRPTDATTRHVCTNIQVQLESEHAATGHCYILFFQGERVGDDGVAVASKAPSVVEYHDTFSRTTSGWKIQSRRIQMAIKSG